MVDSGTETGREDKGQAKAESGKRKWRMDLGTLGHWDTGTETEMKAEDGGQRTAKRRNEQR